MAQPCYHTKMFWLRLKGYQVFYTRVVLRAFYNLDGHFVQWY